MRRSTAASMASADGTAVSQVPMTMISGFLGSGKTTLLRYLLENQANMKFGVIVNDVATINVDAKLIRNDRNRGRDQQLNSTADLTDTIELANGCACEGLYCLSVPSRRLHSLRHCINRLVDAAVPLWVNMCNLYCALRFSGRLADILEWQQLHTRYGDTNVQRHMGMTLCPFIPDRMAAACATSVLSCNKLVNGATDRAGCSIKDELFESLEQLVALSDRRGVPFDRYSGGQPLL